MYRSILVPLDGSPFSEHALPLALSIARRFSAALHLLHVHQTHAAPVHLEGKRIFDDAQDAQQRASERSYLDEVARRLGDGGAMVASAVVIDPPGQGVADADEASLTTLSRTEQIAEAIHAHLAEHDTDLIVMTTHGRGGLSRAWLGSAADRLIRKVPLPILLVHPHDAAPAPIDPAQLPTIKHILVPLDGSPLAEQILERAVGLATAAQTEYTLLQVIEPVVLHYAPAAYAVGLDQRLMDEARAAAYTYLDRVAERLRSQSLRVRTQVTVGPPAPAILDYAHTQNVDLIAMATHGRGGFRRLMLGSVADKVVRGAHTPVLVQRPSEA